jgi:hypothetical protein
MKEDGMVDESVSGGLRNLWQGQNREEEPVKLEEIRKRAERFRRRIESRNRREFIAAAITIGVFIYFIAGGGDLWFRTGCALSGLGMLVAALQLRRRGIVHTPPEDLALADTIAFYRRELIRQRNALRSVWTWYIAPMIPGLVVFAASIHPRGSVRMALYLGVMAATFFGVWHMNRRAAACLDRQIESLDQTAS